MRYRENKVESKQYKLAYRDGIERIIKERQERADEYRKDFCEDIFDNREKYLSVLREQLGWPLTEKRNSEIPKAKTKLLSEEDGYSIYRMTFEVFEGVPLSGILLKRDDKQKRPLVIVQHGYLGTPEIITGFFGGDTANYSDMAMRVFEHGVNIFAPQLIMWHEEYEVPIDRTDIDARLKSVGGSIAALEIYGIQRLLDYFENQSYVNNLGMIGFSYGGFYTLFTAALDDRIKAALSCSYFNDRNAVTGFPDWRWKDASFCLHDAEVSALVYPRKLVIQTGDKDDTFFASNAQKEYDRLCEMCGRVGTDWVDFEIYKGKHEFVKGDKYIEKVVQALH